MKRSPLKRNPTAIRDWVQASRKPLKPVGHKGKIKLGENVGPLTPSEWRAEVWRRCGGKCVMTGQSVSQYGTMFEWQCHHPLAKGLLAPEVRYDPRNGIVLVPVVHMRHENAYQRVPFEKLPESCMIFAEKQGSWAVEALLRAHPRTESN
jgi:hypothetical protein